MIDVSAHTSSQEVRDRLMACTQEAASLRRLLKALLVVERTAKDHKKIADAKNNVTPPPNTQEAVK